MQLNLRMTATASAALVAVFLAGCNNATPPAKTVDAAGSAADATASAVAGAASAVAAAATGDAQVVKLASVAPMSGSQAHYGKDNANGVQMAVDELNTQGLVIGGKKIRFEAVLEDDAADPKQGAAVAQKLCDAKVSGVVGHLNSGTTIPASKIYNDCNLPMVTGAATNPALTKPGYKMIFRIIANDNALGADLANEAKTLGLKRVAVIDDRTAYGQGIAEVFTDVAKKNGIEIVSQQFTNDKAVDFMSILTEIKGKKPDGIFFGGMDAQAAPMLRQMETLGMTDVKYFGGDGICTTEIYKLSSEAQTVSNVICAVGGGALEKMPKGPDWKARYDKAFPGQFQVYSPYTYDATMVIVDAMKRADSVDPAVYVTKLAEADYDGVTAKIAFEPNGEMKNPATTLSGYKDGQKFTIR
ncbi:MAG: branched-chain amino acid ABC transporter substrate-binding protein [Brachymonas sp.]|nr:branched-chain amino acid ABC transporter substrate-binding protein [Brachymonas sp.]